MDSLTFIEILFNLTTPLSLLGDGAMGALFGKITAIGKVAIGLGFVIFIHELGHFVAAKTFGVRCDKFYVGFDVPLRFGPIRLPSTLAKFQWGETEYGIGIIPLGGYVKMLGQDDDPRKAKEEADRVREGGTDSQPLDPRSYPAKPVWQRMIIISAGVVLNLVSAVFLAAAAYFYGVPYTPSVVGRATAGGPAWLADLQPGDRVLRVNEVGASGENDPEMRYTDMLANIVISGINAEGQPIEVHLERNGQEMVVQATPSPRYRPDNRPILGFTVERAAVVATDKALPYSQFDPQALGLQSGDRIVAIDGQPLPVDSRFNTVLADHVIKRLGAKWNQSVVLGIDRPANAAKNIQASSFEVTLPPDPRKSIGLGFGFQAVTAVRPGSAGEQAGFQVGDKILAIDGQPLGDVLALPTQFAARAGNAVQFSVQRGSEQLELKIASPQPAYFDTFSISGSGELSLGGVGVAFSASPVITSVNADQVKVGVIEVGDQLAQYRWVPSEGQLEKAIQIFTKRGLKSLTTTREINSYYNIVSLMESLRALPVGSRLEVELIRNGKTVSAQLEIGYSEDQFATDERGLTLAGITRTHQTTDIVQAVKLGFYETKKRFFDVLGTLKMLFAGNVGVDDFAGPLMLFSIATEEASHSTSRLLLFLTLLSANLAILNFLPIPALDGGHMMFLICEAIRGKPVNEEWQIRLTMLGVLSLLGLMAFVILNDIYSLL